MIIVRPKNHNSWLQWRENGIGSSEVGTILGVNPWETPYQLWRRKKGIDPPKEETFAMKAGHLLEDAVSKFWQDATGRKIIQASSGDWLAIDEQRKYLRVSPDRTYWLSESRARGNKGILECKTTQKTIDAEEVPLSWFAQLQYQLGVMGYEKGSLAWLCSARTFGYKDFVFVPSFYEQMVEKIDAFWKDCILGNKEPEAMDASDIQIKYLRSSTDKKVEVGSKYEDVCARIKDLAAQIKELKKEQDELEETIKLAMADAELLTSGGRVLATWRSSKDSVKFDDKAFLREHPEACQPYMYTTPGARRFSVK